MEALLDGGPALESMPHLREWLELARPVREVIERRYAHLDDRAARLTAAAEENVLHALDNLQTFSAVRAALAEHRLRLHGWFFDIAAVAFFAYDPESGQFQPLPEARGRSA
jgi:carbonic anhydrase